ncbi:Ezrin/radixin/moesin family protein [Marinoscillum sp. MHG1-6]|uniref:Ezrin/radixin/moesin family protein n=1 Tax=Marinoscillum sp. MHG1-6 TaxID=2959627 RepID=UPI00215850C8|nr:Ezrin/radixin/moesin family protein [Marinoscillum sp. MHG1-6]
MKRILLLTALVLCVAFAFEASAQKLSKKEKKEWKKRLKKAEPEDFKNLVEENKSLKGQVSSLQSELSGVDNKLADKDDQIAQYESQISELRSQLSEAKKAAAQPKPMDTGGRINDAVGVVFKVQIGAFAKKDLAKYDGQENFNQDTESGLNKFTLGIFRDYWEADTFKKYLREMGVKDAFIVSYKDGQRVNIKEVLEGVSKS